MIADPAASYERLHAETAEMLGLDLADLSLVQGLGLDLVSLLRLEIDSMQGAVLSGKLIDLPRLVACHGMLAKLLPERSLVAPAAAEVHSDARERLAALIAAGDAAEDERLAEASNHEDRVMTAEAFGGVEPPAATAPAPSVQPAVPHVHDLRHVPAGAAAPPLAPPSNRPNPWKPPEESLRDVGGGNVVPRWISPSDWGPI